MSADHFDRKQLEHDPYRDAMFAAVQYVYARRRQFILGAVSFLAIAAAGLGGYAYLVHTESVESDAFAAATELLQANLPPGFQGNAPSQEERFKAASAAFQSFLATHPRASLAPAAWLYLARIAWEQKRFDEAATDFQHVLDHGKSTSLMKAQALLGLGNLKEAQGKPAEAIALFERMAEQFQDLKQLSLGRAALAAGNPTEAREHFLQAANGESNPGVMLQAKEELNYLP